MFNVFQGFTRPTARSSPYRVYDGSEPSSTPPAQRNEDMVDEEFTDFSSSNSKRILPRQLHTLNTITTDRSSDGDTLPKETESENDDSSSDGGGGGGSCERNFTIMAGFQMPDAKKTKRRASRISNGLYPSLFTATIATTNLIELPSMIGTNIIKKKRSFSASRRRTSTSLTTFEKTQCRDVTSAKSRQSRQQSTDTNERLKPPVVTFTNIDRVKSRSAESLTFSSAEPVFKRSAVSRLSARFQTIRMPSPSLRSKSDR